MQNLMEEDRPVAKLKQVYTLADSLYKKTHFTQEETRSLVWMYQRLSSRGKMDRLRFREILSSTFDITDDIMLDRIFRVFDINNDALIDESEWIMGLSVFLRGTLGEQIEFCYFVYDINGDRSLAREELFHCLKNCLIRTSGIEEDVEESVKELVEIAMKKLDVDRNGQITFEDFQLAVQEDPLLLEACGTCLPSEKTIASFFIELTEKYQVPGKIGGNNSAKPKVEGTGRFGRRRSSAWFNS